jgi:hypothetical protein
VLTDGISQHSNEQACSIKTAKFFSNSTDLSLLEMNLFHEVTSINGNKCSVNDIPTAALTSYPPAVTSTLVLEKITYTTQL